MTNTNTLTMLGYSATAEGHIELQREGVRYVQERCAVIHIEGSHEMVERLLAIADSPRALTGRAKNSAVLLFKADERNVAPSIQGHRRGDGVFDLALPSGERITVSCKSAGLLDLSAFTWQKNRSPLEIERDRLPLLTSDISEAVLLEAFKFATWAPSAEDIAAEAARKERRAKIAAGIASGKINPNPTPEQQLEIDDNKLVAAHEGAEYHEYDGNMAALVLAARRRVASRKAAAEAARVAALTPEERAAEIQAREDAATVERFKDVKLSENDSERAAQIVRARARHAARQNAQAAAA
jgi:hypothetical protein